MLLKQLQLAEMRQYAALEIVVYCFACLTPPEDMAWFPKGAVSLSLDLPGLEVEYAAFLCLSPED